MGDTIEVLTFRAVDPDTWPMASISTVASPGAQPTWQYDHVGGAVYGTCARSARQASTGAPIRHSGIHPPTTSPTEPN